MIELIATCLLSAGVIMGTPEGWRAVEVGVRKAAGADRGHLVLQFIGESVFYALAAVILAMALAELALPGLNALLQRRLVLSYWSDPAILAFAVGLALLLGVAAGIVPRTKDTRTRRRAAPACSKATRPLKVCRVFPSASQPTQSIHTSAPYQSVSFFKNTTGSAISLKLKASHLA